MGMSSESYPRNKGLWTNRAEGGVVVALIEGVMVVYVLERTEKALLEEWRY